MKTYSLSHLSDQVLLRDLATLVTQDRITTAAVLAHVAEVDARKLYLPAAYPSMFAYCVGELRLSEEAAFKRIHAARTARRFPAIFAALAEGRLHLSAVVMLAPHLTEATAVELLASATHRTRSAIEQLLVRRFPRPEVPTRLQGVSACDSSGSQHAPGRVGAEPQLVDGPVGAELQLSPGTVQAPAGRAKVTPLAPGLFALQVTLGQGTCDKLRHAQDLLSHQLPSGDVAKVLDRALDALIGQLEKRRFAATSKPRPGRRSNTSPRCIPAHVRRTVWERGGGQCTFVSATGRRCESRKFLEFDHIDEVARGGEASVDRIRLRCRAHNQYAAECTFGTEFMRNKRHEAAAARAAAKAREAAEAREAEQLRAAAARARAAAAERARERDVVPWLRHLGFRADEARRAAVFCENIPDAPLEERVRVALSCFRSRTTPAPAGPCQGAGQ